MLKILQARLHQLVNFQMYELDLEKAEEGKENWILVLPPASLVTLAL